jgi:hypothetical protein
LDESGIYEFEVRKALKPKGFGPDINSKVELTTYQFKSLTFKQIKGVLIVFSIAILIAVFVLLLEFYKKSYLYTVRNISYRGVKAIKQFLRLCFESIL